MSIRPNSVLILFLFCKNIPARRRIKVICPQLLLQNLSVSLGLIFDRVGSYDLAFYLAGIPPLAGAIIMFFIPYRKQVSRFG